MGECERARERERGGGNEREREKEGERLTREDSDIGCVMCDRLANQNIIE